MESLFFIKEVNSDRKSPIYYKSKQIDIVAHSYKDAESFNVKRKVDDLVFIVRKLEILLFGSYQCKIQIKLFVDSKPTLESIVSLRQVEKKNFVEED